MGFDGTGRRHMDLSRSAARRPTLAGITLVVGYRLASAVALL